MKRKRCQTKYVVLLCSLPALVGLSFYLKSVLVPSIRTVKPNILIVSIDTLRADHLSCYGYKHRTTPNLDGLALEGHRFQNAYTSMPTTLPAHASLFTSLYPRQLSVARNGEEIPDEAVTLAEILQEKGYTTAAFVSALILNGRYRLNQGFQTYDDILEENQRPAEVTITKANRWLEDHRNNPFLLFVHLYDPHLPYEAPPHFAGLSMLIPPAINRSGNLWPIPIRSPPIL